MYTVYISRSDGLIEVSIFILMTCNSMKIVAFILVEMKCFQSMWLQDATHDSQVPQLKGKQKEQQLLISCFQHPSQNSH